MSEKQLSAKEFSDPSARARMAPFWFWNCEMSAQRVQRQVGEMAGAGCGGFFIHARQGLSLPYLSSAWFERVRVAIEEARRLGLEAWLYDEFPYPSGIAGGLLTANHPELKARELKHLEWEVESVDEVRVRREMPLGRLLCAVAAPVRDGHVAWDEALDLRQNVGVVLTREQFWLWPMGHIPTNEKRFMADEGRLVLQASLPPGHWKFFAAIEREQSGFKYFDCFFDPLHPDAARVFIDLTHERYAQYMGEHFGVTIPGIFTDETEPPSWSPEIEKSLAGQISWEHDLPALRHDDHPRASEVRLLVRRCALRLFQERWEAPIADWCRRAGLIWAAEKPTWRPSQFAAIAQPATDAGHRRVGVAPEPLTAELRANHRAAMAAAEHQGNTEVRCENFHSLGWGATLQDQKWATDWLAVQGVNRFTPHAFYATSSGLQKHDAAPSFFEENPYWPRFKLLADYTARLGLALSTGREKARIAVLHPTRALWQSPKPGSPIRRKYEGLLNDLLKQHFIFHIVDAQSMLAAQPCDGGLELGLARYETLIALGEDEDEEALAATEKARGAGLQVLGEGWLEALEPHRALSVRGEDGREIEEVWAAWREAGEQEILFLANTSGAPLTARVQMRGAAQSWELWSLESGQAELLRALEAPGAAQGQPEGQPASTCSVELAAFGSALLVGSHFGSHAAAPASASQPASQPVSAGRVAMLPLDGEWKVELDRPNALRLNRWLATSVEGSWQGEADDSSWAQVEALPLSYRDTMRGGWQESVERRAGVPVWYRRRIECEFVPHDAAILIEDGAILGRWTLWVNGQPVPPESFEPVVLNGGDKAQAPIGALLQRGRNTLALKVEDAPEMGGLRTPLHLIGGFGLRERVVVQPSPMAPFNDLVAAGRPHFSGVATYHRDVEANSWAGCHAIALPDDFELIAQLWIGGRDVGTRAWAPYHFELPEEMKGRAGEVEVRIAVTNTLLPFYEGQQWDAQSHRARSV